MGINVPLNLAHASMLTPFRQIVIPMAFRYHPEGIPRPFRRNTEPPKLHVKKNIYNAIPNHIPLSPLAMPPFRVSLHEIFLHLP